MKSILRGSKVTFVKTWYIQRSVAPFLLHPIASLPNVSNCSLLILYYVFHMYKQIHIYGIISF